MHMLYLRSIPPHDVYYYNNIMLHSNYVHKNTLTNKCITVVLHDVHNTFTDFHAAGPPTITVLSESSRYAVIRWQVPQVHKSRVTAFKISFFTQGTNGRVRLGSAVLRAHQQVFNFIKRDPTKVYVITIRMRIQGKYGSPARVKL